MPDFRQGGFTPELNSVTGHVRVRDRADGEVRPQARKAWSTDVTARWA